MKILILSARDITHPWAGGAEVNIHEMMKKWLSKGHEVTMFCAEHYGGKRAPNEENIDGMRIIRKGKRFSIYMWTPFYYWFRLRKHTDLILDIDYGIPFFSPLFSRKPIICIVNHVHGFTYFIEEKFPVSNIGYFLETKIMPLIYSQKTTIAISDTTKKELTSLGMNEKKITVINPGVDHNLYKAGNKKFKKPTVLYVGRIRYYKRVDMLIYSFKKILSSVPDSQLLIIGEGVGKLKLKKIILKEKLQRKVKMLGYVSLKRKNEILKKSWVFVTPSMLEGWGMTVIEANASGVPVIAFDVPGLRDSIKHLKSGILVKTQNELERAMIRILTNKKLRKRLSLGALNWAKEFNWEKSADEHLRVFKKFVK